MLKIGLTGGIGSGKSTVAALFKRAGFTLIDADIIAREVLIKFPEILQQVKEKFGEAFFDAEGDLKRKEFGNYIFKYPKERIKYEDIIMPFIKNTLFEEIQFYEDDKEKVVIIDAPTLIENGLHEKMDYNILVWVDKDTQISRIKSRDSLNEEEAINRIDSQMSLEEKKEYVNFIIDNSHSIGSTQSQVEELINIFNMYKQ